MSEQQSQKRGVVSEAQKTQRAREGYEPIPPSQTVAGAFGDHTTTDRERRIVEAKKLVKRGASTLPDHETFDVDRLLLVPQERLSS